METLAAATFGAAFNFYRDGAGADVRRARLRAYLESRADASLLLVGEAPGYRGARVSGVPFTSERQLTGSGPAEATATIVHRVLADLGLEEEALLWAEIEAGRPFLTALAHGRRVVAVGRVAGAALGLPSIRHPSRGGAAAFREGLLQSAVGGRLVRRFF